MLFNKTEMGQPNTFFTLHAVRIYIQLATYSLPSVLSILFEVWVHLSLVLPPEIHMLANCC